MRACVLGTAAEAAAVLHTCLAVEENQQASIPANHGPGRLQ